MAEHKTLSPRQLHGAEAEPLRPPEYRRDAQGQFARPEGFTLKIAQKKTGLKINKPKNKSDSLKNLPKTDTGDVKRGPGRPRGSKGRIPLALKEAILRSFDNLGGEAYLEKLAIENSSAYAGLLGKVLPTTLAASESDGGAKVGISFERVIVWPDGRRQIEGTTPKALPAPATPDAFLALNGRPSRCRRCPLLGVKRTLVEDAAMSAFDPKRTSAWLDKFKFTVL